MDHTSKCRLSNDLRQELEKQLLSLLSIFRGIKIKLGSSRSLAHTIFILSEPDLGGLVFDDLGKEFRETAAHQKFVDFLLYNQILWDKPATRNSSPSEIHMFRLYAGAVLLRVMISVDADAEKGKKLLLDFINFLNLPDVPRYVNVPLLHLDMVQDLCDLGDFGTLTKSTPPKEIIPESVQEGLELSPRIALSFPIRMGHFHGVTEFPLSDILRAKVGLLRLAVCPLTAYNHFSVEHVRPWELKIVDNDFSGRFWSKSGSVSRGITQRVVTIDDEERIMSLRQPFGGMRWETVSAWRLAMDRLDDASFKLECGSPDAILDLVIGLESVFVDRDSRQESTHKVAVRVSRFLEDLLPKRKEMFNKVKQMYKDRSTLAHGQRWSLDKHTVARVEDAAGILSRVLQKMVELESVDLDLDTLDLA